MTIKPEELADGLARFMRKRDVIGFAFETGIISIDLEHIRKCRRSGDALLETILTAVHEYAHLKHPNWSEQRVHQWWRRKVHPRRKLLAEFAESVSNS